MGRADRRSERLALGRVLGAAEANVGSKRGALTVFVAGLAVFGVESIGLPVVPGRDFGTYLRFYAQMWDWHSVFPMSMLYRTPVAPLVIGGSLDAFGGSGTQLLMACLFAGSIVAWTRAGLAFGRRTALLTAAALLLYPGYGILFHELASDSVTASVFAGCALALTRAVLRPTPDRFAVVGLAIAVAALTRPANQALVLLAVVPLVLRLPWRARLASTAACATVVLALLGGWTVNNGLRYGDYTVARGGTAYLPLFRALVRDHIVGPANGPASRRLASAVAHNLLTAEPYRSYGITLHRFFARAKDREFEDLIGLSDRVWGWHSNYATLRAAGIEAVRAHPGVYARGVAGTIFTELWHPLFIDLPASSTPRSTPAPAVAPAAASDTIVVNGRRLPRPSDGDIIPSAHQDFYSTTLDGHIRAVWTSPTVQTVVFSNPNDQRRFIHVDATAARLAQKVPPYPGSAWLTLQFSRSSKLFPPPLVWLAAGLLGLLIRRPRHRLLAALPAVAALLVTTFNALTIYPIIQFAIPLTPALILCGAAGLVGSRPTKRPLSPESRTIMTTPR
jgi:hypothetical protein